MHIPDHEKARELRFAWYRHAGAFDANVTHDGRRAFLAEHNWNDNTFANMCIGLEQSLAALDKIGLSGIYNWAISRDAYDFSCEPYYQYLLLSGLVSMVKVLPSDQQRMAQQPICARYIDGWAIDSLRSDPLAIDSENFGWIHVPFCFFDILNLAIDSWLICTRADRKSPVRDLCAHIASQAVNTLDFSLAIPYWRNFCARAIAALPELYVPHRFESEWCGYLFANHRLLTTPIIHQQIYDAPDNGLTFADAATAFGILHETAHIFQNRATTGKSKNDFDRLEQEIDADSVALEALWNSDLVLRRSGQDSLVLWFASGLFFYFGQLVMGNIRRCQGDPDGMATTQMAKKRLIEFLEKAANLTQGLIRHGDPIVVSTYHDVMHLMPSMVAYCNAFLDFAESTIPASIDEAAALRSEFLRSNVSN